MKNRSSQQTLSPLHRLEGQTCVICMHPQEEGMYIFDHFICRKCEGEMVQTDVGDHKYPFFIERLRKVRCKENV